MLKARWYVGLLVAAVLIALIPSTAAAAPVPPARDAVQTPGEAYAAMGSGAFVHYGLATYLGKTPWQYDPHQVSPEAFDPADFDPDQWMRAFSDAGATYVVFTAKHHDGFTLWPSDYTDFGVESSADPSLDVVGEVVRSAREHGLKVVMYYSWYDRYAEGGDVHPQDGNSDRTTKSPAYLAYAKNQIRELLTEYGSVAGLWMDIAPMDDVQLPELADFIHTVSPGTAFIPNFPSALVDHPPADVVTFEGGYDPITCGYQGKPAEQAWTVASGPGWWQMSDDALPNQDADEVIAVRSLTQSLGATFTLNAPPGPSGRLPAGTVRLLEAIGDRTRGDDLLYGAPTSAGGETEAHPAGAATDLLAKTYWQIPAVADQAWLQVDLPQPTTIDHTVVQLTAAEAVAGYRIEYQDAGGSWRTAHTARDPGFPSQHDRFDPVTTQHLRLVVDTTGIASGVGVAELKAYGGIDDSSPAVTYTGKQWLSRTTQTDPERTPQGDAFGGTVHRTRDADHSATARFTGTGVQVRGAVGPDHGTARLSIDQGPSELVDLHRATGAADAVLAERTGLAPGPHTVTLTATGDRPDGSHGSWVTLDRVTPLTTPAVPAGDRYDERPDGTRVYDDGTSRCGGGDGIHYTGSWSAGPWPAGYAGTRHYSKTAGDHAELTFDGTGVAVQVQTRPGHGIAAISVDGGPAERVDTYSNPPRDQAVVWQRTGLPPGQHTVRITVTGDHNPAASNSWVSLDAVLVPPAPEVFHAGPDGSGSTCSTDQPCSLTQAQATVRDRLGRPLDRDVLVLVADGTYRLDAPLRFGPGDSGRDGHTVTWQAAPGAHPVLSGARRISGWSVHEAGIWRAPVPAGTRSRQLYVDGLRATRARHRVTGTNTVTETGITSTDPVWDRLATPAGVEVEMTHYWKDQRCPVVAVTGDEVTMAQPCWHNGQIQGKTFEGPTWLSNAYELLDEAGEFHLDSAGGWLYYKARTGEDLATAEVELPVLQELVTGRGTAAAPVHDIVLRGITFSHATWLGPDQADGYALGQAGVRLVGTGDVPGSINYYVQRQLRGRLMPGNVAFEHAYGVVVDDARFTHLGAAGLAFGLGARGNKVTASEFVDISGNGVQFGDVTADAHHPDDPRLVTRDNTITGSLVTRAGAEYQDCVGVFVGYTTRTTIDQNTIYDLPYSGISAGWGWGIADPEASGGDPRHAGVYEFLPKYTEPTTSTGNLITNNLITHVMQTLRDGGGVYTLGAQRGTVIAGNHIDDVPGGDPAIGGAGANGVYTDEGTRYTLTEGNVVTAVPHWVSAWNPFSIQDNTYAHNYTDVVQGPPRAAAQNTLTDNTVVTDGAWPAAAQQVMRTAGAARPFGTLALTAGEFAAGGTTTVTATVTNTGDAPQTGVAVVLSVPPGWQAVAGPQSGTTIAPGESLAVDVEVSVPAATPPGSYPIGARARYEYGDLPLDLEASLGADLLHESLQAAFNSVCISDDSFRKGGDCDGFGYSYSAQTLAAAGLTPGAAVTRGGLIYTWPDVAAGTPDNVRGAGQQIRLAGTTDRIGLLFSAKEGAYDVTIHYADGTRTTSRLALPAWVNKPPTDGTALVARLPYRNTPFGTADTEFKPGVFELTVPVDPAKQLRSIELPDTGRLNVFALATA